MLERLTVENFQRHERLTIELDPHVTTIVGPTDAGKSAVIRALIWLATNRPGGEAFVRDGADGVRVVLELDGRRVAREKGAANVYELDGKTLKAFGSDVPEDVATLLRLSEINFQRQHDSPFWFGESAGEVSRQLNAVVDLGIIDDTLANLNARVRRNADGRAMSTERAKRLRGEKIAAKRAKRMDEELRKVELLDSRLRRKLAKRDMGRFLVQKALELSRISKRASESVSVRSSALQKGEKWAKLIARSGVLTHLLGETKRLKSEAIVKGVSAADAAKELQQKMGDACQLCGRPIK